jgi:hypothetical protein
MNTVQAFATRFDENLKAARAGTLTPRRDPAMDVCRCGEIRARHVGANDTCPASRADSTDSFRQ